MLKYIITCLCGVCILGDDGKRDGQLTLSSNIKHLSIISMV